MNSASQVRKLYFDGYNIRLVGANTLQYDTWYHIAVTYDGSRLALYLNGQLVAHFSGYTSGYLRVPLDARARAALRVGRNIVAIHVHQTDGGQYLDLGLDEVITP